MKVKLTQAGCTLIREPGDPRLYHASTVGYHMKRLLRNLMLVKTSQGEEIISNIPTIMPHVSEGDVSGGAFPVESAAVARHTKGEPRYWHRLEPVRFYPDKHGLTACRLGLIDRKANIILWHERYAIENAATEFNRGRVFFMRTTAKED